MNEWTKLLFSIITLGSLMMAPGNIFAEEKRASDISFELVKSTDSEADYQYFYFDALKAGYHSERSDVLTPQFFIFKEIQDEVEAKKLIEQLDMQEVIEKWGANVWVLPVSSNGDNREAVANNFLEIASVNPVRNVKVIGIDEGATFVNDVIVPQYGYFIAGALVVNGDTTETNSLGFELPAYVVNPTEATKILYTQNKKETNMRFYSNDNNPLDAVRIVDETNLQVIFKQAWEHILSKNYRMHNATKEFYATNPKETKTDFDLEIISDFDSIGIDYVQHELVPLDGEGQYTWYEYVPNKVKEAIEQSVPLIVSLHGFNNDPRLQGDTSGWVELAAKENLIVVSPEWQDEKENFSGNPGLGENGLIKLIEQLKVTYPQIDPSRIYISGLSAGGSKTALWNAKYSNIFAAGASVSAPGIDKKELLEIADKYQGGNVPYLYIVGDHDCFQMVPVDGSSPYGIPNVFFDDPNVSMFEFIQAYQKMNQLPISEKPDLSLHPYFGLALQNEAAVDMGNKEVLEGELLNDKGQVLIKLATIKDWAHWNHRSEAEYIWNFLKQFSRNTESGKLIINE